MSEKNIPTNQELTIKQKKYLKGLAHSLSPVVQIGKDEITQGVLQSIEAELMHHELIKVKIGSNSNLNKMNAAELLPTQTKSALVQLIGKTIILFKANNKKPKDKRIYLPKI